jgi:hypothetical protein
MHFEFPYTYEIDDFNYVIIVWSVDDCYYSQRRLPFWDAARRANDFSSRLGHF